MDYRHYSHNQWGMGMVAQLIRESSAISSGGPFVTVLPRETLEHYKAIDTVVVGEEGFHQG